MTSSNDFNDSVIMHKCEACEASFHSETELVVHSADCHVTVDPTVFFKEGGAGNLEEEQRKQQVAALQPTQQIPSGQVTGGATSGHFSCGLCDKKFKKETHLSQHMQVHEIKQWECDVCKKSFTTKYFLKKHKRLHTGEQTLITGDYRPS